MGVLLGMKLDSVRIPHEQSCIHHLLNTQALSGLFIHATIFIDLLLYLRQCSSWVINLNPRHKVSFLKAITAKRRETDNTSWVFVWGGVSVGGGLSNNGSLRLGSGEESGGNSFLLSHSCLESLTGEKDIQTLKEVLKRDLLFVLQILCYLAGDSEI